MDKIPNYTEKQRRSNYFAINNGVDERRIYICMNDTLAKVEVKGNIITKDLMAFIMLGIYFCIPGASYKIRSCHNMESISLHVDRSHIREDIKKPGKCFIEILCDCIQMSYKFVDAPGTKLKKIFEGKCCEIKVDLNEPKEEEGIILNPVRHFRAPDI